MVTLEAILERNNLNRAYKQVKANKGGAGVDGMTVDTLLHHLRAHAVEIVKAVKAGKYTPSPVRRVMIPKEEKGKYRPLGIPTVVDRVGQHSQVLLAYDEQLDSLDHADECQTPKTGMDVPRGRLQIGSPLRLLITAHCGTARWVV